MQTTSTKRSCCDWLACCLAWAFCCPCMLWNGRKVKAVKPSVRFDIAGELGLGTLNSKRNTNSPHPVPAPTPGTLTVVIADERSGASSLEIATGEDCTAAASDNLPFGHEHKHVRMTSWHVKQGKLRRADTSGTQAGE